MLDICERFNINPSEWDKIEHGLRVLMRAKWELDRDYRVRMNTKQEG